MGTELSRFFADHEPIQPIAEFTMRSPSFNLIFVAVLSLTLTSGGTAFHLASQPPLTEPQERVLNSAIALWTTGMTTIIGLLSNRSNDDDEHPEEDNQS
ncbi:MAG: hypothetical protein F6J95_028065 [Leptolyngbya sp. SIO1E4]|nr:hypothetical protein [Leptolyngbya sp. SIO1E4]